MPVGFYLNDKSSQKYLNHRKNVVTMCFVARLGAYIKKVSGTIVRRTLVCVPGLRNQKRLQLTVSPAMTMATIDMSFMRMLRLGPDVSLNGSPTVSPTTVAL